MQPRFEIMPKKTFAGMHLPMAYTNNKTSLLWRSFMPRRQEIANPIGTELYSIEVYPPGFFVSFNPDTEFEKWAAVEVPGSGDALPAGMEKLNAPEGLYAVFTHYGPASNGHETYMQIFTNWLPASGYAVDERPHLAIMGPKYKSDSADSEEEIWIPVKAV